MKTVRSWPELVGAIACFRNKGLMVSNFYPNESEVCDWIEIDSLFMTEFDDNASCLLRRTDSATFIFFYLKSMEMFPVVLQEIRKECSGEVLAFDWICRTDEERSLLKNLVSSCNFVLHTSLRRMSLVVEENGVEDERSVVYATENDIDGLSDLFHSTFDSISERIPTTRQFYQYVASNSILLIKKQSEIAGVAVIGIQKKTMYLRHIVTNKNFRGQGIATRLLNKAFFLSKGCSRYILWVIEDNHPAIGLYKKFGYEFEAMTNYTIVSE